MVCDTSCANHVFRELFTSGMSEQGVTNGAPDAPKGNAGTGYALPAASLFFPRS